MASVNVYLGKVPFDNTYKDVLYFASQSDQTSYFSSVCNLHTIGDSTVQRINDKIRYPAMIETLRNVNYCMIQNENYSNRWYYCFVTDMQYINDGMTEITIEIDVYQTWLFDTTLKPSFVSREHVTDDTRGANLVDEGLELGDYVCDTGISYIDFGEMDVVFAVSSGTDGHRIMQTQQCGVFSGWGLYAFKISTEHDAINTFIGAYDTAGKADAIQCAFMIPDAAITIDSASHYVVNVDIKKWKAIGYGQLDDGMLNFSDYTVKNNKLLTYPYIFLHCTNFEGQYNDYHYEYFSDFPNIVFIIACNVSMSPSAIMYPQNYKGVVDNYDEGITLQNFPQCTWANDFFKNWFAQNSVSVVAGTAAGVIATAAGIATANPIAIAGGVVAVTQEMGQIQQHATQPATARGNGGDGSLQLALGTKGFGVGKYRIRKEYAERIDKYFDMYGYKVNTVKTPNLNTRPYWNFVKTIDCNITGDIPNKDMQRLKKIYNDGVTLWHGSANMYNYDLNNH